MRYGNLKRSAPIFRIWFLLACFTFMLIVCLGTVFILLQPKLKLTPMSGLASSIPVKFFNDMIAAEIPNLNHAKSKESYTFSTQKVSGFMLDLVLHIHPGDKRTLLASTIPGLYEPRPIVLYKGDAEADGDYPIDNPPPADSGGVQPSPQDDPDANGPDPNAGSDEPKPGQPDSPDSSGNEPPAPTTEAPPAVLIYHSHNRESWVPELPGVKDPNRAFDSKTNVTLLGTRLADKLEALGIGAKLSKADYQSLYKGSFKGTKSYIYSRQTVKEALAANLNVKYIFDIHRDAGPRSNTTKKINGQDYAQLYFIIGMENPDWKENEAFAKKIHNMVNARYPGLSKGIYAKSHKDGDGIYNQNLSPNSSLIEVGGVMNTLEECNRTIDVLAEVISELYKKETKTYIANFPAESI